MCIKLETILSPQENQILEGLMRTLQTSKRDAVRIAIYAALLIKSLSERTKSSWSLQTLARFIFIAKENQSGKSGLG